VAAAAGRLDISGRRKGGVEATRRGLAGMDGKIRIGAERGEEEAVWSDLARGGKNGPAPPLVRAG
jgi:hypothetical protein